MLGEASAAKYPMKTGRRIANPDAKQLAGTFRADRHADIQETATPDRVAPPVEPPARLTEAAKAVWREEYRRVVACGLLDADTSMFCRYCEMEAAARAIFALGELPQSALLTELRRTAELLSVAGPRSRLARAASAAPAGPNPFTPRAV